MNIPFALAILAFTTPVVGRADESDAVMPEIVANAETKVDVLIRHLKSTGECFPDPDVKVRFEDGRVMLGDSEKYKNRTPRISQGLVAFKLKEKWGACDKDGKVVLAAKFDTGFEFHEGLAGVSENGKRGFIDKEGKWVIKPRFDLDYTWDFVGEVCPVYLGGRGAVIDKKGDFVWRPGLLRAEILAGGIYIQTSDDQEGFLDDSGKLIPDREPNQRYYKPGSIDAESAGEPPITIPPDKAIQAKLFSDTIESSFEDPCEKLVLKIERLLSAGLDVNVRDSSGNSPLLMVADWIERPAKAFKVLLDAGADVNARNEAGETALHRGLILENDPDAVRFLIERGISVTATNNAGESAFSEVAWLLDSDRGQKEGEEPDRRRIVAKLLFAAGADRCKDYMGGPITVVPDLPRNVDPTVSKLMDPALRNDAFQTILSWQKYRSKPSAIDRIVRPLRDVIVCPQKEGPPIYAVFPASRYEHRDAPRGHIMLIDADGAIIPYYMNANSIDDDSEFKDVNGDGVVDEVGTIAFGSDAGSADVLHVLPVTRDQRPILNLALKRSDDDKTKCSWRLVETGEPGVFSIELGLQKTATGGSIPKVEYRWSKEKAAYVGPTGGGKLPFMRFTAASPFDSAEYDEYVRKREDK